MNKQTETLSKATPRPWTYHGNREIRTVEKLPGAIQGRIVAKVDRARFEGGSKWEANAALIVQAVNQYEVLCAVAEAAKHRCGCPNDELNKALAALEAVRKGAQ